MKASVIKCHKRLKERKKSMKKRTKQYFTAVTIAAMMVSSYGTGVPTMAAKVTLPRNAKVVVGAKKVLKLKNNKRVAKWKVSKGKKYVKIVKKSKKSCTVKGIKKGNATVQAVIGAKKYSCKVKVTAKVKNKVKKSKRQSVTPAWEHSKEQSVTPAPKKTEIPATATPKVNNGPEEIVTIVYDGTNSDEIKNVSGKVNVIVKDGVTEIGSEAFSCCSGLTSITISESVTKIGDEAFFYCSNLESIKVDENNRVYDSRENCNAIIEKSSNKLVIGCKNTKVPSGVTSIGARVFSDCNSLASIMLPDSMRYIGDDAFYRCSGLQSITIPSGVTSIGEAAFCGCSGLTSITLPETVTRIGRGAFSGCSYLTSITIPEGVTEIGDSAFFYCSALTSITIPESVKEIDYLAFSYCDNLTNITWKGNIYASVNDFMDAF